MNKNDLKALVGEIYENLLARIDAQKDATREEVIKFLQDSVSILSNINDKDLDSIERAKEVLNNSYKELVNESLTSYENTNEKFEQLTILQEKALQKCTNEQIDLSTLTAKFSEIQSHMTEEVQKANSVIKSLSEKVKALEESSVIDSLTKVFNRRALTSHLDEICSNKNITYNLHIIMLDIDNFKDINDRFGHVAGDKILIFIANILKKTLRDGDKIFRYGGEEFVIVLNRSNDEECGLIANRVLKLISSNNLIYLGQKISVTASIGITKFIISDTPDSLLARADKALYTSKNNGKNQVSRIMK